MSVKILFFIDCLVAGGKERRLIELMKFLKIRDDIRFELVVMSNDVHYKEVFEMNIPIHYIIRKTKKDITVFNSFYKLCKKYKPDIVHCWDSMTAVYLVPTCLLLNIKFINGMVTNAPLQQNIFNKRWLLAKLTFPFSSLILGNSQAGLTAYNAPRKKSIYIHNGFNFERIGEVVEKQIIRKQLNINTKYVIGMVATFSEFKDYKTYFSAAHLLLKKREDITFLAIGSKTDSAISRELAGNFKSENFRLLGKQSNVESLINAMDICILSTFSEGVSNAILEYMALGKPVIATYGGGTNEIIRDNDTGFLISPSNPEELAQKIEILLNDEALANKMGLAGKERIKKSFSIEKMVDKYITTCKNLL
jgi:glycosyltransferase involved in cell wall biosynthesis